MADLIFNFDLLNTIKMSAFTIFYFAFNELFFITSGKGFWYLIGLGSNLFFAA